MQKTKFLRRNFCRVALPNFLYCKFIKLNHYKSFYNTKFNFLDGINRFCINNTYSTTDIDNFEEL